MYRYLHIMECPAGRINCKVVGCKYHFTFQSTQGKKFFYHPAF